MNLALTITQEAEAIIIRDDRNDTAYIVNDADYPALVDLIEKGDCIGTLVHESFLLTVAYQLRNIGKNLAESFSA